METQGNELNSLPKGNQEQSHPEETATFEKLVAETGANLAENARAAEEKRGRGRPKGSGKNQKAGAENSSVNSDAASEPATDAASMRKVAQNLKPIVRDAIKTPFVIAAFKFHKPGLAITEEEADTPAHYLTRYLQLQLPGIENESPKTFNLYAFMISMALLILRKIPLWAPEKVVKPKAETDYPLAQENPPPENRTPARTEMDAMTFFAAKK